MKRLDLTLLLPILMIATAGCRLLPPKSERKEKPKVVNPAPPMPPKAINRTMAALVPPKPSLPKLYTLPLQFPPGATNCNNWDVWESHDLKEWHVCERNIYTVNHIMFPTSQPSFYRPMGRL